MKRIATTLTLRRAVANDAADILSLLRRSDLPVADIPTARPEFVVASDASTLIGVGALQILGKVALLRSLAVETAWRHAGVGSTIVRRLEGLARERFVNQIVVLTETATPLFERHGYQVVERADAPASVRETEEFRTLCPETAVCLIKALRPD